MAASNSDSAKEIAKMYAAVHPGHALVGLSELEGAGFVVDRVDEGFVVTAAVRLDDVPDALKKYCVPEALTEAHDEIPEVLTDEA